MTIRTFAALARELAEKKTTSQDLTEQCLTAIKDESGEGIRVFLHVDKAAAIATAQAMDRLRAAGVPLPPYAGIPISIKDLFDVAGQVTRAGSTVLSDRSPATRDAEIVTRLRRAGLVIIGRTNMSEFAFSGVGINPHYGTPAAPWDRAARRIPGGSSSGAAISVSDGMSYGAIGTDTGGSCRIPAAFTGLVGYKPTARRIPSDGAIPLSLSLDSIGPIAPSVGCCAALDAILANEPELDLEGSRVEGLRLAVVGNFVTNGMDSIVSQGLKRALAQLSRAGASVKRLDIPAFDHIPEINALGGFAAAESYAWHRELIEKRGRDYDPRVRVRIERGKLQSAADYIKLRAARDDYRTAVERSIGDFDALVMPTVPIIPPRIDDLAEDDAFAAINLLLLRNPSVVNLFDGCAISLPVHDPGAAPVGLMLAAPSGRDHHLLRVASAIEACVTKR